MSGRNGAISVPTRVSSAVALRPASGGTEDSVFRQQATPLDGGLERVPAGQRQAAVVRRALELPPGLHHQSAPPISAS